MPASDYLAILRLMVDEPTEDNYTDAELLVILEGWTDDAGNTDVNGAASEVWRLKAARFSSLVDITEAGSTRKNGELYKAALQMAKMFGDISNSAIVVEMSSPTTRAIERA